MLPFESKFTAPDFVTELILVRRTLLGIFLEFLLSFTTVLINKIFEPAVFEFFEFAFPKPSLGFERAPNS